MCNVRGVLVPSWVELVEAGDSGGCGDTDELTNVAATKTEQIKVS